MKRRYDSPVRDEAARLTRRRILDAAQERFLAVGYGQTTISSIATMAGVSEQTVYGRIGNKAAILKGVYDVMLIGDDEPVPMAARPEFRQLQQAADVGTMVASYARLGRLMAARMRPLLELVWGVRAVEPDLDQLARTVAGERRIGATMFAETLIAAGFVRPGMDVDTAVNLIWVLNSPEVYLLHVRDGQMTDQEYEDWLATALLASLA